MMKVHPHLSMSLELLDRYDGSLPFHLYLKKYFQQNRRCGSRDRKQIKRLCFAWFRCGRLLVGMGSMERMRWSLYLVTDQRDPFYDSINGDRDGVDPELDPEDSPGVRLARVFQLTGKRPEDAFPLWSEVSDLVDYSAIVNTLFVQPRVWLRVRSEHRADVGDALREAGIPFEWNTETPNALSVSAESPLDKLQFAEKGWAEVQDLSSQRTLSYMHVRDNEHWYDACAASGGKALLLLDAFPDVRLTVSDNRPSILVNLRERFRRNGLKLPQSFLCDLLSGDPQFPPGQFPDAIIADVPCSGSGTWSRTPERLTYFSKDELDHHVETQKSITQRLTRLLKAGGRLVYITCSVYACENEDRVNALCNSEGMELLSMGYLQGSSEGADTLFCAELVKKG
jgi:16S rRNA (cytosine967-C5)-methyltransferase